MNLKPAILAATFLTLGAAACSERRPPNLDTPIEEAPPPLVTVFTDVAATSGLDFEHFSGATGQFFFPEIMGAGVALLDFDSDGDLDVYALQGSFLDRGPRQENDTDLPRDWPKNRLFRNELIPAGTLHFVDVTATAGDAGHAGYAMGVAVGDIDNDGDPDIYLGNFGHNAMLRNDGNGHFTDITEISGTDDSRWSTSASFLDFDRDGDLDLAFVNYVNFTMTNNKHCSGAGGRRDYCDPTTYLPVTDRLYRNDGSGRFTDVSAVAGLDAAFGSGLGVTSADFDGDGFPDIYVANDKRANQLWINNRDGTFRDAALMSGAAYNADGAAEASMGVTAGDFDGDGDEDLFMTHLNRETNTLYVNDGRGNFRDDTDRHKLGVTSLAFTGFGTGWFDYDNDGLLDVFIANGAVLAEPNQAGQTPYPYRQGNQLLRNTGDGRFRDVSAYSGAAMALQEISRGAAFGDVDNDGDVDVLVSNNNGLVRLLRNDIGHKRNWLRVRLVGTESARDAAGARVLLLRDGELAVARRVHTDGSYGSASDSRVLFGLGDDRAIAGVAVLWPLGRTEVWRGIVANTEVTLIEGEGGAWQADGARVVGTGQ